MTEYPARRNEHTETEPMRRLLLTACALICLVTLPGTARAAGDLIEKIESPYNTILIFRQPPYVTLAFGHKTRNYVESRRNPTDLLELSVEYTRPMIASLAYTSDPKKFLMIGMGGGSISWYVHQQIPDSQVTAIELDPEIIRLAGKYYRMKEDGRLRIVESDGRVHLLRDKGPYDVIFVDAYRGPFVPFHLLTKEFFELAKKRLAPGGVIAQNIEPSTMLFDKAQATILSVFDNIDLYPAAGNVVAIAYDGPRKTQAELDKAAAALQEKYRFRYDLRETVKGRQLVPPSVADTEPLTDDFAPVNTLKQIPAHNKKRQ